MALHKIQDVRDYHRYLQENHAEVHRLLKELLILVTSFFRDPGAFEVLASKVIPDILAKRQEGSPVRVWVPACATGEEALSIAMLFVEAMENPDGRANLQVFATDIDPDAIQRARAAEYPETIGTDVSPERLKRFFIKNDSTYRLKSEIRDMVVFAVQDLVTDPPFSRLDLISCRNVLIYMDAPLQRKILPLFHYTLNENGYLFLGASESIGEHSDLFSPVDIKAKIYKSKKMFFQQAAHLPFAGETVDTGLADQKREASKTVKVRDLVERIVLDEYAPACVLVDEAFDALYFQGATDRYLSPPSGQPTFNIVKMVPDALRYRLPAALQKAARERETTILGGIPMKLQGDSRTVDVIVRPVSRSADARPLVLVVFTDRPSSRKGKVPVDQGIGSRIVQLEHELQGTRESLQATIEELEASNEELRSTNEELQSMNEDGRWFSMRILPYRTRENLIDGVVITFFDVTERKRVEQEMEEARIYAEGVVDTVSMSLLTLDPNLRVISANRQFYRTFQITREETLNRSIFDLGNGRWDIPELRRMLERVVPEDASFEGFEIEHDFPAIGSKSMILNIRQIQGKGERPGVILLAVEDTTRQVRMEKDLRAAIGELEKQVAELKAPAPGRTEGENIKESG